MKLNAIIKRPLVILLCGGLLVGCIGLGAFIGIPDASHGASSPDTTLSGSDPSRQEVKGGRLFSEPDDADMVKDETVYALVDASGDVQKLIVSDWIQNSVGNTSFSDKSELSDIEVVKGDETYTMDKDNLCVWNAQGNDVYYQGNIEKELPVKLILSYKLDGKSISPEELAGKSGHVTIRFDYENTQYEMVDVDGKQQKIYVPFVMMTGTVVDNEVFSNVEVTNGNLNNDGNHTVIAGIAFPGLQSNLNVDKEDFEVPDYIEINADVKNFELPNTVTVATNEIFSRLNVDDIDSVDELMESMEELTDAMGQLIDGSSQLSDGLNTLLEKSGELASGNNQLAEGAASLLDGTGSLEGGIAELASGSQSLSDGLGQLNANGNTLSAGATQVFQSLLGMANSQLAEAGLDVPVLTIENYAGVLNEVIASLDTTNVSQQAQAAALAQVTEAVNAQRDVITASVTEAVREQVSVAVTENVAENVEAQVLASQNLTKETYEQGIAAGLISAEQQEQIRAAIDTQMNSNAVRTMIDENVEAQIQSEDIQNTISAKTEEQVALLIEQNMNSAEVQEKITAALEQAQSGAAAISSLKAQLDSYNTFYIGLNQYVAGVSSAKNGADALNAGVGRLKSGSSQLNAGMSELYNGILKLRDSTPALIDGVTELRDGSLKLSDGLVEFNEEGIQKLVDAVDGDLDDLYTRMKATVDVSKNYRSFSGISDDMAGRVKFVYRTDTIDFSE